MQLTTDNLAKNYIPLSQRNVDDPVQIALVGAGGIGARILPTLVKMLTPALEGQGLGALRDGPQPPKPVIYIVDPDDVEERNIFRQPFIAADVGKSKALVLARRYKTPHVDLIPYQAKWEEAGIHYVDCAFMAVDGKEARIWEKARQSRYGKIVIDVANDDERGQVVVYGFLPGIFGVQSGYLMGTEAFPDLYTPDPPPTEEERRKAAEAACGLRVDTQTSVTNQFAASLALNYFWTLWEGKPLSSLGCKFSLTGGVELVRMAKQRRSQYDPIHYVPLGQ